MDGWMGIHTDAEGGKGTFVFDHVRAAVPAFRDEGVGVFKDTFD